ncbi:MAG: ATP-binding cassette domain-containing protein [Ruminococcus sp.]|nr:ATP-binding cassette domain-containing protein [Ruminococcus sp.]MCM1480775.1 ATP-binding cassette domain-containing protein [Muribaculaceae bacterium]
MSGNKIIAEFKFDFTYGNEALPALDGICGSIERGKCIVLCGGSGCGKSTLLRCINHLIPQFYEGELKGFCNINGNNADGMSIGEIGRIAASVFQNPRSHFFTVSSSSEVAFGLENHGISHAEIVRKVDDAFRVFGLEKLKDRSVHELSSGERQLVAILSAWAMDTEIFLLDEPTANLDYAAINQLKNLLGNLKRKGKTLLLSEHRLHYLNGVADEYWVMSKGKILRKITAEDMQEISENECKKLMLRSVNLKNLEIENNLNFKVNKNNEFSVKNLCCSYKKSGEILSGAALSAHTGEIVGIIGSNGSGKTTLGKAAAGLLKPSEGEILYNGLPLKSKELLKNVMFVMQETEFQFFTNSVENELRYGRKITPELNAEIEMLLKKFGMLEYRGRHPFSLSGGQMQKLSLMLAYLSEKSVIILDEPTAGLDAESLRECAELINQMRKNKIIFIITHDVELIAMLCTKCVCIANGRVSEEIILKEKSDLNFLIDYMENNFKMSDNCRKIKNFSAKKHCDPRTKLLIILAVMAAAATANARLILTTAIAVTALAFFEGFYFSAIFGAFAMILLTVLGGIFPGTMWSFLASFVPRLISPCLGIETIIGQDEASRTLTALRKIHVPETLIMICSVVFRFFPVLSNDIKLLSQSLKTRGVFTTFREKILALPEYIEILLVPMALRVIRIAETLSASAETRGIALKCKRSSYLSLRFTAADFIFLFILALSIAAGLIK